MPRARRVPVDPLAARNAAVNRDGWGNWEQHRVHRARVMATIEQVAAERRDGITLLGAGNCNDVDLEALAARFGHVHLVDVDARALARARSRVTPVLSARVVPHAPVELTGLLPQLSRWRGAVPTPTEIESAGDDATERIKTRLPPPVDVAVSCCVLSQLGWAVERALGSDHPALDVVRLTVLRVHLATLASATRAGGVVLLLTDVCSSATYPLAEECARTNPTAVLDDVLALRCCYAAANPVAIARTVRLRADLRAQLAAPARLAAWLWSGWSDLTYLVLPLRFDRL